jgi:hypothetical protein
MAKGLGKKDVEFAELYLRKIVQLQLALPERDVVTAMMKAPPIAQEATACLYRKLLVCGNFLNFQVI